MNIAQMKSTHSALNSGKKVKNSTEKNFDFKVIIVQLHYFIPLLEHCATLKTRDVVGKTENITNYLK